MLGDETSETDSNRVTSGRTVRRGQILALIETGLTHAQVAERLGMSVSGIRDYIYDPDGSKKRVRIDSYRKPCPRCGTLMDGSSGRRGMRLPQKCAACRDFEQRSKPLIHGTRNGYQRGCRCRPCRDGMAAHVRDFYADPVNAKKRYRPTPPERARAYRAVKRAIKERTLAVPDGCQRCGAEDRRTHNGGRWLQAHHADYTRPLDVLFLCAPCHRQIHKEEKLARTSDA